MEYVDIYKSLLSCADEGDCRKCVFWQTDAGFCADELNRAAAKTIKALCDEIEKLKDENEHIRQSSISTETYNALHGVMHEIVLCKDCKKRCTNMCGKRHEVADMDFCNNGERKDGSET